MCFNHIRRESMQNEHLWRNLSTTTMMSTDFDRSYQQQGFNLQFPAGFNCDLAPSNPSLLFSNTEITERQNEIDQPDETTSQVKMELQARIKSKCLERGKEVPKIEEMIKVEPPKAKIKEEDPEVLMKRRQRNKVAAMKCRRLKRERIEKLEKKRNSWEERNRKIQQEKEQLYEELCALTLCLTNHCCKKSRQHGTAAWTTGIPHWKPLNPDLL